MADEGGVFFDLLLPLDAKELDLRPASEGVEGLKIENEEINKYTVSLQWRPLYFQLWLRKVLIRWTR